MAVARDATSGVLTTSNGVASATQSHTCTGSNLYLIAYVADWSGADSVTGVTYNGVAMTQLDKQDRDGSGLWIYAYGLANPSTGANNIVASRSNTANWMNLAGVSYTGVSQVTSPVDATASNNSASGAGNTALSTSITTVADNTAVSGCAAADNGNIAAGTNETQIGNPDGSFDAFLMWESTTFPKTPTGATSYTVTYAANGGNCQIIISLAPVAAGPVNLKSYDGNVKSNIKSVNGNTLANMKSLSGNA